MLRMQTIYNVLSFYWLIPVRGWQVEVSNAHPSQSQLFPSSEWPPGTRKAHICSALWRRKVRRAQHLLAFVLPKQSKHCLFLHNMIIQPLIEDLQLGRAHSAQIILFQCWTAFAGRKFFLLSKPQFLSLQFHLFRSGSALRSHRQQVLPSLVWQSFRYLKKAIISLFNLTLLWRKHTNPLSLFFSTGLDFQTPHSFCCPSLNPHVHSVFCKITLMKKVGNFFQAVIALFADVPMSLPIPTSKHYHFLSMFIYNYTESAIITWS